MQEKITYIIRKNHQNFGVVLDINSKNEKFVFSSQFRHKNLFTKTIKLCILLES